ncbi:protein ABHD14A-like [Anneissia japonica]|uniref:protein ABHD14A-like n=1 Tax=Anneissia japonica TaxID=1529436 RepID=UPI0014259923|nr:protein ABHD14A-like [Anneissia japonica]
MLMGVQINKTAILLLVGVALTLLFIYYPSVSSDKKSELSRVESVENFAKEALENKVRVFGGVAQDGQIINMTWEDMKENAMQNNRITCTEGTFEVKGLQVYRRECVNIEDAPIGTLLFLHGQSFKSLTWKDLGTLIVMASYRYRTVAIDLPGYGETPKSDIPNKADFLMDVMTALKIEKPILISPSMSGQYALPLVMKHAEALKGYVPVAPVATESFSDAEYKNNQIPALVVYGEKDTMLGEKSASKLRLFPNSQEHKLKDAGHAAYLNQPLEFHRLLRDFSDKLFGS